MATYKEIKGVTVQTRDTDPTVNAGSWASSGNMNTARTTTGMGTQTAGLVTGGNTADPGPSFTGATENYNGSTWTEVNDLNTGRREQAAAGTNTASITFGGIQNTTVKAVNESWNGSSWTEVADLNAAKYQLGGCGTQTAAIAIGGVAPSLSPNPTATSELWNGSAWTEVADLNTARTFGGSIGISTAALLVAGDTNNPFPNRVGNVEQWNGSSWTEIADVNTLRAALVGSGTTTDGLAFGGATPAPARVGNTEAWDGSAWTEVNDMATGRSNLGGDGTASLAFAAGGYTTTYVANTEEWSFPSGPHLNEGDIFLSGGTTLKGFGGAAGIPAGTWATGGTLNAGHGYGTGFGLQTAAVCCFGG